MTTTQPETPEPSSTPVEFNYEAWLAEAAKHRAEFATQLIPLKTSMFDFLENHGIVLITVDFDGCGDSGQIEGIFAFDEHGEVALPTEGFIAPSEVDEAHIDAPEPIKDAIETLAYDLLETEHDGWEINDGAYGEFRFDVIERSITLTCNLRFTSSELSESSW